MINGKTKDGFEYILSDAALDNMELVDALEELDEGNTLAAAKVISLLLGKEQKKRSINFTEPNQVMFLLRKRALYLKRYSKALKKQKTLDPFRNYTGSQK